MFASVAGRFQAQPGVRPGGLRRVPSERLPVSWNSYYLGACRFMKLGASQVYTVLQVRQRGSADLGIRMDVHPPATGGRE